MRFAPVRLSLLTLLIAFEASASIQWQVIRSDTSQLIVEISIDGEDIRTTDEGYLAIEIPGLYNGGEPGLPELPADARWIALPPQGALRFHVESTEVVPLRGGQIQPMPIPRLQPDRDFDTPRLVETREPGEGYDQTRASLADALRLGEVTWMARQRVVPLRIAPILFDTASASLSLLRRARVRIEFEDGESFGSEPGAISMRANEFLNPQLASRWRGLPAAAQERVERMRLRTPLVSAGKRADGVAPFVAADLESDEVRLRVTGTGLWQVRLSDFISDANIDFPTNIPRSHLRLYEKRASDPSELHYPAPNCVDVPLQIQGNPDPAQPIANGDVVIFHGYAPRDLTARQVDGDTWPLPMDELTDNYNTGTVYFLALMDPGSGSWKRMAVSALAPSSGSPQPYFAVSDHFEIDGGFQDNPDGVLQPRYHWASERIVSLDARATLRVPRPGSNIDVGFALTRTRRTGEARIIDVSIRQSDGGGTVVVDELLARIDVDPIQYDRLFPHSYPVSADLFQPGFVDLHLERTDALNALLRTYLGWIELSYDALYQTVDNGFVFDTGITGVDADVEVTGYETDQLLLYEITDPDNPVQIALGVTNVVQLGPSNWKLSIRVPQGAGERRRFAGQTLARIPRIRSSNYSVDHTPDIFAATGPAQVLAIGPELFRNGSQAWLDHRSGRDRNGWQFTYVDIQQIYDEFSGGMKSSSAIKEFVEYYYLMHDLRAVVLFGDGNENAREVGLSATPDHVPPSVHSGSYDRYELLASDKWYVTFDLLNQGLLVDYPNNLNKGPDLLIGRLPANDTSELMLLINKIVAYEAPGANDAWRGRALYVADDAYSSGFLGSGEGRCYSFTGTETEFATSQSRNATVAGSSIDGVIDGQFWNLGEIADDIRVPDPGAGAGCYDMDATRVAANLALAPVFYDMLSQGWLLVSYQGHANWNVLAHEQVLVSDVLNARVNNNNKPFIFYGMGCHVSDFLRTDESIGFKTVAEEFVMLPGRGAIASYGSSGYEFLHPNAVFMETLTDQMFQFGRDSSSILDPDQFDSPWILAEVTAAAERHIFTTQPSDTYRQMTAQYNLLGDPLLRIDAVPPRVYVRDSQGAIDPGADLMAEGAARAVSLTVDYADETNLGSLRLLDVDIDANLNDGLDASEILRDHSALFTPDSPADPRLRQWSIDLPVAAQEYQVVFEAFDGAYRDRRPTLQSYHVRLPITVSLNGREVLEGATLIPVGSSGALQVEFTSPIELAANEIEIAMTGASLASPQLNSSDNRNWVITAGVIGEAAEQAMQLTLAGALTELSFAPAGTGGGFEITRHLPYPNPSPGPMDIVCESTGAVAEYKFTVYDASGRPIYSRDGNGGNQTQLAISWDGRDLEGDALANGVYLYRVHARSPTGEQDTQMGRLVIMR